MALQIVGPGFSTLVRSVRMYCLEKGLEVTFGLTVDGQPVAFGSAAHRRLHPFCQVPILLHGEQRVFETLAICRYLDREFPTGSAASRCDETEVDQWSNALITSVDQCLVRQYLLKIGGPRPDRTLTAQAIAEARQRADATLAILETQLGDKPFLCGQHFSLADALLAPMLDYLAGIPGHEWRLTAPRLAAYLARLQQRACGREVLTPADFSKV